MNKNKIQEQIDLLLKYRYEYLIKLRYKVSGGIYGFELKNYDIFISSLISGIVKQEKIVKKYEEQYHTYFMLWKKSQCKLNMWKMMSLKLLSHNVQLMQLGEQVQLDEYVQKSFLKKR
ncbi:MAG: flagellar export protein FliJ [Buchnera aphidicola (Meitanaphis elongallis)]